MPSSQQTGVVVVEKKESIARVKLNNPPLNILTKEIKQELLHVFETLQEDHSVRVVLLGGDPSIGHFSAGANLKEFPDRVAHKTAYRDSKLGHRLSRAIRGLDKPVIAVVDGYAYGGGCELSLFADFRIASERARFALPEVQRGLFPGTSGSQLLPRLIGAARAKEVLMFGKPMDSRKALDIGLVHTVTPDQDLWKTAEEWAQELASRPAVALRFIKRLVDVGAEMPLEAGLELESTLFEQVFETEDVREGVAAFFEKREPRFQHR